MVMSSVAPHGERPSNFNGGREKKGKHREFRRLLRLEPAIQKIEIDPADVVIRHVVAPPFRSYVRAVEKAFFRFPRLAWFEMALILLGNIGIIYVSFVPVGDLSFAASILTYPAMMPIFRYLSLLNFTLFQLHIRSFDFLYVIGSLVASLSLLGVLFADDNRIISLPLLIVEQVAVLFSDAAHVATRPAFRLLSVISMISMVVVIMVGLSAHGISASSTAAKKRDTIRISFLGNLEFTIHETCATLMMGPLVSLLFNTGKAMLYKNYMLFLMTPMKQHEYIQFFDSGGGMIEIYEVDSSPSTVLGGAGPSKQRRRHNPHGARHPSTRNPSAIASSSAVLELRRLKDSASTGGRSARTGAGTSSRSGRGISSRRGGNAATASSKRGSEMDDSSACGSHSEYTPHQAEKAADASSFQQAAKAASTSTDRPAKRLYLEVPELNMSAIRDGSTSLGDHKRPRVSEDASSSVSLASSLPSSSTISSNPAVSTLMSTSPSPLNRSAAAENVVSDGIGSDVKYTSWRIAKTTYGNTSEQGGRVEDASRLHRGSQEDKHSSANNKALAHDRDPASGVDISIIAHTADLSFEHKSTLRPCNQEVGNHQCFEPYALSREVAVRGENSRMLAHSGHEQEQRELLHSGTRSGLTASTRSAPSVKRTSSGQDSTHVNENVSTGQQHKKTSSAASHSDTTKVVPAPDQHEAAQVRSQQPSSGSTDQDSEGGFPIMEVVPLRGTAVVRIISKGALFYHLFPAAIAEGYFRLLRRHRVIIVYSYTIIAVPAYLTAASCFVTTSEWQEEYFSYLLALILSGFIPTVLLSLDLNVVIIRLTAKTFNYWFLSFSSVLFALTLCRAMRWEPLRVMACLLITSFMQYRQLFDSAPKKMKRVLAGVILALCFVDIIILGMLQFSTQPNYTAPSGETAADASNVGASQHWSTSTPTVISSTKVLGSYMDGTSSSSPGFSVEGSQHSTGASTAPQSYWEQPHAGLSFDYPTSAYPAEIGEDSVVGCRTAQALCSRQSSSVLDNGSFVLGGYTYSELIFGLGGYVVIIMHTLRSIVAAFRSDMMVALNGQLLLRPQQLHLPSRAGASGRLTGSSGASSSSYKPIVSSASAFTHISGRAGGAATPSKTSSVQSASPALPSSRFVG